MKHETKAYGRLIAILIGSWFAISISASALLIFKGGSPTSILPPLPIGLAVVTPIVLFGLWFAVSPGFRDFALALDPRILTLLQTWRIGGFTFVVLYFYGILPGVFALPAGLGDMAIGATAPLAAIYIADFAHRRRFIVWQILGVFDLLLAVTLGVLASASPIGVLASGLTTDAMSVLPLSMIPTFAVPLLLILHFICIAQAMQWRHRSMVEGTTGNRTTLPVAG
jgi:hypothetical protein